jgi:uncharacterized protein (DUF488 family)
MTLRVVTIGVYGFGEAAFFHALRKVNVDTFCDIRQRRGVRGAAYTFANSQRLQARLADLGIRYIHRKDLAPSKAVRSVQDKADKASKTAKRQRTALSPQFAEAYRKEFLSGFDSARFISELSSETGVQIEVVALFCVEREPQACHRSLLAEHLQKELNVEVEHIVPEKT